jgi:hypothetical protein
MKLERKLKTALDETRLLILGAQVLFGFAFQGAFQDLFGALPAVSRIALAVILLMTPAALHRIAYDGEDNGTF